MKYLHSSMLENETIIFSTRKHLIIFFIPLFCTILAIFAFAYMLQNPILANLAWVPWLVIALLWGYVSLEYFMSHYMVTNKRLRMREGFFFRHVSDVRLNAIFQLNVNQSLLGQMLVYGDVSVNAFGVTDTFTLVARPYLFQKYLNEQLDKRDKSLNE